MQSRKTKYGLILLVVLLFISAYLYDFLTAKQISISVVADPKVAPADGETIVTLSVTVRGPEGPREGDNVTVKVPVGNLAATRALTNDKGTATFHYKAPKSNAYQKAENVKFEFRDESVSTWIEVDPIYTYDLNLVEPTSDNKSSKDIKVYKDIFN